MIRRNLQKVVKDKTNLLYQSYILYAKGFRILIFLSSNVVSQFRARKIEKELFACSTDNVCATVSASVRSYNIYVCTK